MKKLKHTKQTLFITLVMFQLLLGIGIYNDISNQDHFKDYKQVTMLDIDANMTGYLITYTKESPISNEDLDIIKMFNESRKDVYFYQISDSRNSNLYPTLTHLTKGKVDQTYSKDKMIKKIQELIINGKAAK